MPLPRPSYHYNGSFELNQLFATSRIRVPKDFPFRERTRGIANRAYMTDDEAFLYVA